MRDIVELVREVTRAFSAGAFWILRILGRCPVLGVGVNAAPLALITHGYAP